MRYIVSMAFVEFVVDLCFSVQTWIMQSEEKYEMETLCVYMCILNCMF